MTTPQTKAHYEKTIQERQNDIAKINLKYPEQICIYVDKYEKCNNIKNLENHKYLSPKTMILAQFMYVIRQRLVLEKNVGLIFFINNMVPSPQATLGELYEKNKNDDGFLYIIYTGENCFG